MIDSNRLHSDAFDYYTFLAHCLSPAKTGTLRDAISRAIEQAQPDWGLLLHIADLQMATPLWCCQMQQDSLLSLLPPDLQAYVEELTALNRHRNTEIATTLCELLHEFNAIDIEPLLIKGAASLVQGIYPDTGARLLGDIDMLVPPERVDECEKILSKLGYREMVEPNREPDHLATDARHHHINPYIHKNTGVIVEIHTNTGYAITSGVLPGALAWQHSRPVQFNGYRARVMSATHQVLLNMLHALLPHREFISGDIELRQLAEYAHLLKRFNGNIDWPQIHAATRKHGLHRWCATYQYLARELMATPLPESTGTGSATGTGMVNRLHARRILFKGNMPARNPRSNRLKSLVPRLLAKIYYLLKMPQWIWTHPCYAEGPGSVKDRLTMLHRKFFDPLAWKKV